MAGRRDAVAGLAIVQFRRRRPGMRHDTTVNGLLRFRPHTMRQSRRMAGARLCLRSRGTADLDIWVQQISGGAPIQITNDRADDVPLISRRTAARSRSVPSEAVAASISCLPSGPARPIVPRAAGRAFRLTERDRVWSGSGVGCRPALVGGVCGIARRRCPHSVRFPLCHSEDPVWAPTTIAAGSRTRDEHPPWPRRSMVVGTLDAAHDETGCSPFRISVKRAVTRIGTASGVVFASGELWRVPIFRVRPRDDAAVRLTAGPGNHLQRPADGAVVFAPLIRSAFSTGVARQRDPTCTRLYADERSVLQRSA